MKKFGLIGFPLAQSFSKKFFTAKFEKEKIEAQYDLYELKDISEFIDLIKDRELCGLNVTIPYKEKIIRFLDEIDETATKIGAVNVIKFIRSGEKVKLKGYNTDAIGFENSLKPFLKSQYKNALILGTGGSSKAVDYVLRTHGIKTTFVSRTPEKSQLSYDQLTRRVLNKNQIIVNATPLGMFPIVDECPEIPYQFLTANHFLYDLVYNPVETLFLKKGKEQGAQVFNGRSMLNDQALASWEIWNTPEK
jgi:shikimate dehydrogenase